MAQLPTSVVLRSKLPPAYNQEQFNSCTANALAGAIQFYHHSYMPSRMFIYYNERKAQNCLNQDDGSTLSVGLRTTSQYGAPVEAEWPYDEAHLYADPGPILYTQAVGDLITNYAAVDSLEDLKSSLAAGWPVVIGMSVYPYMESEEMASSGVLKMPAANEKSLGGHAVLCVGYNDATQSLLIRNSWGTDWGQQGYFWMPYAYASNRDLSWDWWAVKATSVENAPKPEFPKNTVIKEGAFIPEGVWEGPSAPTELLGRILSGPILLAQRTLSALKGLFSKS